MEPRQDVSPQVPDPESTDGQTDASPEPVSPPEAVRVEADPALVAAEQAQEPEPMAPQPQPFARGVRRRPGDDPTLPSPTSPSLLPSWRSPSLLPRR